jgi:hypothetical protein
LNRWRQLTFVGLASGTYTVTEAVLGTGWALSALSCTSASTVNLGTRSVTIALSGTSVTCTFTNAFNEEFIRDRTTETIRNFMNRRADLLTSEEPDRNRFIRRLTGSLWRNSCGGNNAPFNVTGSSNAQMGTIKFSTSLSEIAQTANRTGSKSLNGRRDNTCRPLDSDWNPDIDIWTEAHYNYFTENHLGYGRNGNFGIVYLGADYLYSPNLLLGALVQFDSMTDNWKSTGQNASGTGWMVGPYATVRLTDNLFPMSVHSEATPTNSTRNVFWRERTLPAIGLSVRCELRQALG